MKTKQRYVVGFMFNEKRNQVALIRKLKPEWQRNKLNGIGGKVEEGEPHIEAMVREFKEETGYTTMRHNWFRFCEMSGGENDDGGPFEIHFFATHGDLSKLESVEKEQVELHFVSDMHPMRPSMVENLSWLIGLAIDHLTDGRPLLAIAKYP